ncbi:CYFA0S25e01156g1_1 [Cyberlindnera fabianii]|uniref:CYFA0S25e01156g1_1 n=1 Tax=Cyberlindnera fabianii TaxID=36022 RepID=A0A061B9T9_CYBFA|nr:CYFA0S25e01156g1_1 [Cyberlindnera fabianii]
MASIAKQTYVDPILNTDFDPQNLKELTQSFPPYYQKITHQCSLALKCYKQLLALQYQTNAWEFATLKASVNLNFNHATATGARTFDIKIAKKVLDKCNTIDDEISIKHRPRISQLIHFIKLLSVEEYLSDPGTLLLKVYFKLLNLKNELTELLNVAYTKAKLLVIAYELTKIMEMIDEEENPVALDNTDFQSTLNSYKDFVGVLIDQLDRAVADKDSDQIEECLGILSDVEKMYESVRMNFFFTEEWNDWENEQQELLSASIYTESSTSSPHTESYQMTRFLNEKQTTSSTPMAPPHTSKVSRRGSVSSTASSSIFARPGSSTISEELPYLMQAFDEARDLERELSTYQQVSQPAKDVSRQPSLRNMNSSSTLSKKANIVKSSSVGVGRSPLTPLATNDKTKSHLQSGINTPNMGFSSNLLNNLYGLHPGSTPFAPSHLQNEVD